MFLKPNNREELARALADASASKRKVVRVDLSSVSALVEHKPEDMTATVEAGMTLGEFQRYLGASGQWLPIDPAGADTLTIGDLLAHNLSGPRRFGYGTIRDYLIGIKVALADGRIIKAGGKVVKNVAGYDLCKLFVGAKHSLGIIVEATFKLRPAPEEEKVLETHAASVGDVKTIAARLLGGEIEPAILDVYSSGDGVRVVTAFAGAREDVAYQLKTVHASGAWKEGSTAYNEQFFADGAPIQRKSVLPSETAQELEPLIGVPFVARAGNGIIYAKQNGAVSAPLPNRGLMNRVKDAYDPAHILPYTL